MVPVSEMNEARRQAAEGLEEARLARFKRQPMKSANVREFMPRKVDIKLNKPNLVVNVDSVSKAETALKAGADIVLFGGETFQHRSIADDEYRQVVDLARAKGKKVILSTPRLVKEWQTATVRRNLALYQELRPDGVMIANLGALLLAKELVDLPLYGDYSLNVYNSVAASFFGKQGLSGVTLSPELTLGQVEEISAHSRLELTAIVHGHLALMVSEYCVLGSFLGDLHTGKCRGACEQGRFWLKDRKDELFPVVTDQFCRMHILNAKELSMLPHVQKFGKIGIDNIRIEGKYMNDAEILRLTKLYLTLLKGAPEIKEEDIAVLEHEDITRGHYFRGVL
jgi:putative protease